MTDDDNGTELSPKEKLAELVQRRKEAAGQQGRGSNGRLFDERKAAALSASKSKPAARRG